MMRPVARGLKQVGKIWDSQVGLGCLHICHDPKSFYELTLESGYDHFMYYLIQVDFRRTVRTSKQQKLRAWHHMFTWHYASTSQSAVKLRFLGCTGEFPSEEISWKLGCS